MPLILLCLYLHLMFVPITIRSLSLVIQLRKTKKKKKNWTTSYTDEKQILKHLTSRPVITAKWCIHFNFQRWLTVIIQLSKVDKNKQKKNKKQNTVLSRSLYGHFKKQKNCQNLPDVPSRLTTNRTDAASLLKVSMC